MTIRKQTRPCPGCKFPNVEGTVQCLQCGHSLVTQAPLAWLHCESFQPRPLRPGKGYTIGRDPSCDLVLPHKMLSRTHAAVSVVDGQILFEDRSSNGSSVNGKRVKTATLAHGDVVQLGPFEIHILPTADPPAAAELGGGTLRVDSGAMIMGQLEDEPLVQTLQGLEFNARTGTLEVLSGRVRGTFSVKEGKPWSADLQDLHDDEALLAMLALTEGRFTFTATASLPGERRMSGSITGLLLEHSRRTDEGGNAPS